MVVDAQFLQALMDADDPLQIVWERMLTLWQVETYPDDVVAFYNERETRLNQFEGALYHGYFEIYDLLLERAKQQDGGYVREWLQDESTVVIADSLSVREVGLLQQRLGEHGWRAKVEAFAVAPFPTLTESLAGKLLGTNPANGKDTSAFRYRYVAGPGQMPNLPTGEPTLVWLRLPDKELEQVTVAQATTVSDAFDVTVATLTRLLEQAASRSIFITSDHGYLYATSSNHFWEMPRSIREAARQVFARESRAQPLSKEGAGDLRYLEPREVEQRFFVFTDEHVTMRGRYWWASASQNDRCTGHGGLSLVETLVPMLSITAM